jgi:hypothetical protein
MSWQVDYALEFIQKNFSKATTQLLHGDSIQISYPDMPDTIAVISADYLINTETAKAYCLQYPEMDFLCGYRKQCAWEGGAIDFLVHHHVGWGSVGTLGSALQTGEAKTASHKDYAFSYRLIRQNRFVVKVEREFDRVLRLTLSGGRMVRVGMILEYEPTADAIRTFWDRFGPIDVAWNINPNGHPTVEAIGAGRSLGCKVMKWDELRELLQSH